MSMCRHTDVILEILKLTHILAVDLHFKDVTEMNI